MRLIAALILGWLACAASAADIYTWKDKEGRVHYADNPPPPPTAIRSLGDTGTKPGTPQAEPALRPLADQELEFRKRRAADSEAQAKAQRVKAESEESKRNCETARNNLAAIESGQRLVRYKENGEREFLDDAQRAAEQERARKAVADWCR